MFISITTTVEKFLSFFFLGNCASCKSAIDGEASVVGSAHYHPKCFTCADCKAPLGTDKYYIIGGKNYCSKDRYVSILADSGFFFRLLVSSLQFLGCLRTLSLKFQKATTKIGIFLTLPR